MIERPRGDAVADRVAALERYAILDTPAEQGFDDIVALAADCCRAPIALVSLLTAERQWFKARFGFDETETPIADAICAYTVEQEDLLIIPDLTRDARTCANGLVTQAEGLRFYAGARLEMPDGAVIGTLIVLDRAPRPDGLLPRQADGLRRLARQVVAQVELRLAIAEQAERVDAERRARAALAARQARLADSERHWRSLFEKLSEGFLVGELVRDVEGRVTDWRYLDVNAAWSELVGLAPEEVIGRCVREVMPGIEDGWIDDPAWVVDHRTPRTFLRTVRSLERRYEGHVFHLEDDRFAVVFVEVTDRDRKQARQAALLALGDRLRDLTDVSAMTRAAARLVGEALEATRAGFGRIDPERETITMEADWTAPGIASVEGVHRFADYGRLLDELLVGKPLVIEDVRTDPRTAADPLPVLDIAVGALVNMPVCERGRTVAAFLVHDRRPRRWTTDELAFLRDVADRVELGVARLQAEQRQAVLNGELSHRLKNTLAMVQAIATQTLRRTTEPEAMASFERRLGALSSAHDVLLGKNWSTADLGAIAREVSSVIAAPGRIHIDGPAVELGPRAAVSLSLVLHELSTNAAKYGALSVEAGRVEVTWRVDVHEILILDWRESGGPPAQAPTRRGFGSRLISMGLTGTGGVDVGYNSSGFTVSMRASVAELQSA